MEVVVDNLVEEVSALLDGLLEWDELVQLGEEAVEGYLFRLGEHLVHIGIVMVEELCVALHGLS